MKFFLVTAFALCISNLGVAAEGPPEMAKIINDLSPRKGVVLRNIGVQKSTMPSDDSAEKPNISLSIQFDFNSARINSVSVPVLRNLANALASSELQGNKYRIEGHTDAKGGDVYNLKLSQSRADAVMHWLMKNGVAAQSLSAIGKGSMELAEPDEPYSGKNRRVVVILQ